MRRLIHIATTLLVAATAAASAPGMVRIEGGTFTMGSERGARDERPAHAVTVKTFWIDRHAVTNEEFAAFLQRLGDTRNDRGETVFDADDDDARIRKTASRWRADAGFERHPVNEVTWFGARDYCAAHGKRLPTEAEREYATRGRESRAHAWGEALPDRTRARYGARWRETMPVGSFPAGATPEGVFDLAGNVYEWTASILKPYPYRPDDGREIPDILADRVVRGGAADTDAQTLRASWRGASVSREPEYGHHNIGFRCVDAR